MSKIILAGIAICVSGACSASDSFTEHRESKDLKPFDGIDQEYVRSPDLILLSQYEGKVIDTTEEIEKLLFGRKRHKIIIPPDVHSEEHSAGSIAFSKIDKDFS